MLLNHFQQNTIKACKSFRSSNRANRIPSQRQAIIISTHQAKSKSMFNFNQLENMMNNQKATKAAQRVKDLFPVDGEKDPNQVLRHDSSQQIHALVETGKEKGKIKQKIPGIYQDLLSLSLCEAEKSVCAKIINAGDTVVECLDCRADPSCIICMECYKNGDHKGHRVLLKKGFGGCCDCGDQQAWNQQGFCSKHTGETQDVDIPPQQVELCNEILSELYYLFCLAKLSSPKTEATYFKVLTGVFRHMIERGVKGMKLVHLFFKSTLPKQLTISSGLKGTILHQFLNLSFVSISQFQQIDNIFMQMFPYYPFKQLLITEYVGSFENLYSFENTKGMSIGCQIMTSYKLVEDYAMSAGAVPFLIEARENIEEVHHLNKMLTYQFERINKLQGQAPLRFWTLQIEHGIRGVFSYYESLKLLARKEKNAAMEEELKSMEKKKTKPKKRPTERHLFDMLLNSEEGIQELWEDDEDRDDTNFQLSNFLIRHNRTIECQYYMLEEILKVLPILAKDEKLMFKLIKSIFTVLIQEIHFDNDLLIFRPYERLLGMALFFYAKQNSFLLTDNTVREAIRNAAGLSPFEWTKLLGVIQKRMMETFGFFSHMQTCETSGYQTSFYTYIIVYSSKFCLLGHADILILKSLFLLGAPEMAIDFPMVAKINKLEPPNVWNLRAFSGLISELGLLYTGNFSQIYVSFYSEKADVPAWLQEQAKRALVKFITEEGGYSTFQRLSQFSTSLLFRQDDHLKTILKQICSFNKQKKAFELLPVNINKQETLINFSDFFLRTKIQNKSTQMPSPLSTLQLIDKSNRIVFVSIWTETNINSFCQIILEMHDEVTKNKNKDLLVQFYSLPCKLEYLLRAMDVKQEIFSSLNEILFNFDVSAEVRKALGILSHSLSPILEEQLNLNSSSDGNKEEMKKKKQKKLDELKKKKLSNLEKLKEVHEIGPDMDVESTEDECVICRKSGGNLVWVSKMSIRNFQKLFNVGPGILALSFTSCYHIFHEDCISKSAIKRSTHDYLFRCPVCRILGNIFLNLDSSSETAFDRIMHVAMTMREYSSFDIHEEMIKSFYHFILLGYLEPTYVRERRLKFYRQILSVMSNEALTPKIEQLSLRLSQHRILLQPKAVQSKLKVNLREAEVEEDYDDSDMDSGEQQEMRMFETFLQNEREEQNMMKRKNKKLSKMDKLENKKGKKKTTLNQQSGSFYYTIRRILDYILKKNNVMKKEVEAKEEEVKIVTEEEEAIQTQISVKLKQLYLFEPEPWHITLLDELLEQQTQATAQWIPIKMIHLIKLPEQYYWDIGESICNGCESVCQDLFICLLCKWKGCLNNCPKEGIKGHNRKHHGESGAFLRLRDANVYMIGPGELFKVGCLYRNEWDQEFNQEKDWSSYCLQPQIYQKVIGMMLKNE